MGRPLHKKYFGNRNIGTTGTSDNGIGGEGILSITRAAQQGVDVLINSSYPAPILVKPAPTIPGGVTSTSQVIWEVDRIALVSGGSNYETSGLPVNVTFTGLGGGVIARMTANDAGAATTAGIGFGAGANRGEFVNTPPTAALTYEVCTPGNTSGGGDNAQAQVFFRVKRIEVLTPGSGYKGTETFSWNTAGTSMTTPPGAPTFALTVDTGAVGSTTNQENAIVIYAKTTTGGTAKIGDIIKQEASRRYKIKTADGTAFCKLVATTALQYKQAYLVATDANGNTYYVTKLTAHKALLTRKVDDGADGDWLFVNGDSAPWSLTSTANGRVTIENA